MFGPLNRFNLLRFYGICLVSIKAKSPKIPLTLIVSDGVDIPHSGHVDALLTFEELRSNLPLGNCPRNGFTEPVPVYLVEYVVRFCC